MLIIPLADQVVKLLKELHKITGDRKYIFYSFESGNYISSDGLKNAFARIGKFLTEAEHKPKEFLPHATRGLFDTFGSYKLKIPDEYVQIQTHYAETDKIKGAYNRPKGDEFLEERTKMMQDYANLLDSLRNSHNPDTYIIPQEILDDKVKDELEHAERVKLGLEKQRQRRAAKKVVTE